jgi:hypothetical protein
VRARLIIPTSTGPGRSGLAIELLAGLPRSALGRAGAELWTLDYALSHVHILARHAFERKRTGHLVLPCQAAFWKVATNCCGSATQMADQE